MLRLKYRKQESSSESKQTEYNTGGVGGEVFYHLSKGTTEKLTKPGLI